MNDAGYRSPGGPVGMIKIMIRPPPDAAREQSVCTRSRIVQPARRTLKRDYSPVSDQVLCQTHDWAFAIR